MKTVTTVFKFLFLLPIISGAYKEIPAYVQPNPMDSNETAETISALARAFAG
jgi:hypothetical protein